MATLMSDGSMPISEASVSTTSSALRLRQLRRADLDVYEATFETSGLPSRS
jgi:hypothetical protein